MIKQSNSKGFTLMELMVVIAIIGILSSVIYASLDSARIKGRDSLRLTQIKQVQRALELYYDLHGQYPANTDLTLKWISFNWVNMIQDLVNDKLIEASFSFNDSPLHYLADLQLTKVAEASVTPYYYCSIQDPKYKSNADNLQSYGYAASSDRLSYKLRVRFEDPNNPLLNQSLEGTFLDATTTGTSACDKALRYYCVGGS